MDCNNVRLSVSQDESKLCECHGITRRTKLLSQRWKHPHCNAPLTQILAEETVRRSHQHRAPVAEGLKPPGQVAHVGLGTTYAFGSGDHFSDVQTLSLPQHFLEHLNGFNLQDEFGPGLNWVASTSLKYTGNSRAWVKYHNRQRASQFTRLSNSEHIAAGARGAAAPD